MPTRRDGPKTPSVWWLSAIAAVPAMVYIPLFLTGIGGPTARTFYFFSMLAAIPCGPVALLGFVVGLLWRGVSWLTTMFVLIAVTGSVLAFGRASLWF